MADNAPSDSDRPMRALVVGADGFVGRWLVRHLLESGDEVHAIVGPRYRDDLEPVASIHRADVRTYDEVAAAVAASRPTAIYYLAAVSQAGGREQAENAARIGVVGAIHTLTASASLPQPVRFLFVSSAHVYASAPEPLDETATVAPMTVYGAAKVAGERACLALGPAFGVEVIVARAFNHIGPGQASGFLVPSLAERIRAIPKGSRGTLQVGGTDSVRDFTDVRDVVRAYRLLITSGEPDGIYNVASRTGTTVEQLARRMALLAGVDVEFAVETELTRSGDPQMLIGDPQRLEALGWERRHALDETLREVLGAPG